MKARRNAAAAKGCRLNSVSNKNASAAGIVRPEVPPEVATAKSSSVVSVVLSPAWSHSPLCEDVVSVNKSRLDGFVRSEPRSTSFKSPWAGLETRSLVRISEICCP